MPSAPSTLTQPDEAMPGQSRYGWLAARLRVRIVQGEWVPGAALPSEAALAKEHGVALGTLRQALAVLEAQGLLERLHGRGTFVKDGLGGASMLRFFRFRPGGQGAGAEVVPKSTILSRQVQQASADDANALGLPADASVLQLARVRSLDGTPCLLEHITLPLPLFDALRTSDTDAWGDLLYPMYQRVCSVTVRRTEDTLGFGLLDAAQASTLRLETGHPCARVQRRAFDLGGRCVEQRTTLGNAYAFQYTAHIH